MTMRELRQFPWGPADSNDAVDYTYLSSLLNWSDEGSSTKDIAETASRRDGLIMDALIIPLEVLSFFSDKQ